VVILARAAAAAGGWWCTRREPGDRSSFDARLQGELADTTVAELIRELYSAQARESFTVERDGLASALLQEGERGLRELRRQRRSPREFLIRTGEIDRAAFDRAQR
jgi:hypothetical protein